ncbi:D-alanyl-D-alanine carboxypeptidase/D-alanyl-D-alanine-endopeptidase [Sphingobacterium sp. lm-10]|uniref:D-alanyl-D-alanine carboxypeptidase/D-alanyl-D-alanine endopeptidase n=1 Tax=Sphingobacterium sp. lm-10 TaxID=2944904 RepID=UPI002020C400|nr:D-alanyl-D-alanine carboxypeptidase/D-alanyl-D-alanine-endopeptidase [Sphingobacterium sp. lm-10]MCL7989368.1 D-alanyl-D-alanine carboxypeptidase/D-alanyl-D-alanine-endopeptidase [Sphingobacterium sp. lm-10]
MVFFRFLLSFLFTCLLANSYAQSLSSKLPVAFTQFRNEGGLASDNVSLVVMDTKKGDILFEHRANTGMATASTLKVITSITALDVLGPEYSYTTTVSYAGTVDKSGVLKGDLIIKGTGDPTLGSDRYANTKAQNILDHWTFAIKQLGITRIDGRVIGDDRIFGGNQVPAGWPAADIGNYYGAGISGLNWKENKTGITFSPAAIGRSAIIKSISDDLSYLTIRNEVTTGNAGTGDKVFGFSSPYASTILLKGTYGKDLRKTIEISIPDPAYQLARDLKSNLEKEGITINGVAASAYKLPDYADHIGKTIAVHQSPKLAEIIYWFNQKSINLYGEALLKTIGKEKSHLKTTTESAEYVIAYWKSKLNIPKKDLGMLDGSGLSPANRITASAMSSIMLYARDRNWYTDFHNSLPSINHMKMKSGTIGGVLGYTGFQTSAGGEELTFTLFVNNYKGSSANMRQRMFKLLNVLKQ